MPFVVSTDAQELANRVTHRNIPVEIRAFSNEATAEKWGPLKQTPPPPTFQLRLVSEISSPVVGGIPLRATDVKIASGTAIVSYNVEGAPYLGALESIDVSSPEQSKLTSQLVFKNADINSVAISGNAVYFVGASGENPQSPAFLNRARLLNKELVFAPSKSIPLGSYAGTSVAVVGNALFATSGNNGGLTIVNAPSFSALNKISVHDARSVAALPGNRAAVVLSGTPGLIRLYSPTGQSGSAKYLDGARTPESKSTVVTAGDLIVAALGEGGTEIVCALDGKLLLHIGQVKVPNLPVQKTVTNSAAVWNNTLFTASGEAGVYAYSLLRGRSHYSKCGTIGAYPVGSLTLGGAGFSANQVVAGRNLLLAADGVGGLKVLTLNQP